MAVRALPSLSLNVGGGGVGQACSLPLPHSSVNNCKSQSSNLHSGPQSLMSNSFYSSSLPFAERLLRARSASLMISYNSSLAFTSISPHYGFRNWRAEAKGLAQGHPNG